MFTINVALVTIH